MTSDDEIIWSRSDAVVARHSPDLLAMKAAIVFCVLVLLAVAYCVTPPSFPPSFLMTATTSGVPMNITTAWDGTNSRAAILSSQHYHGEYREEYTFTFAAKGIEYFARNWSEANAEHDDCCQREISTGNLGAVWTATSAVSTTSCGSTTGLNCWVGKSNSYLGGFDTTWCFTSAGVPACWLHMEGSTKLSSFTAGTPNAQWFVLPSAFGQCEDTCH